MSEQQQPNLKPCPFCGGAASIGQPVHTKGYQGFFSVTCVDCCSCLGDFLDIEKAEKCWNQRVYIHDDAKKIILSGVQQSQDFDPTLLKRATFFYWLAATFLSFASFFDQPSFREGFAGFLIIFGVFILIYAVFNFARSFPDQEEGQA